MKKSRLLGAVVASLSMFIVSPAHAVGYTIIDLGTLGGDISIATDINSGREIVGYSSIDDGDLVGGSP